MGDDRPAVIEFSIAGRSMKHCKIPDSIYDLYEEQEVSYYIHYDGIIT